MRFVRPPLFDVVRERQEEDEGEGDFLVIEARR